MTIASAIATKQQQIADSYTAVSNKGGTLPQTQNLTNLATAISSIPSGGKERLFKANFWIDINGNVHNIGENANGDSLGAANGILSATATDINVENAYYAGKAVEGNKCIKVDLSSLNEVSSEGVLQYAFYGCTGLTTVDLSSLTTISGKNALYSMFSLCSSLTTVDLSSLTTISGQYAFRHAFYTCSSLTTVDLSSLTTISILQGLYYAFYGCTGLTTVDLSSLNSIAAYSLECAFYNCTGLTDIYFRALTTSSFGSYKNQFSNMMQNTGTSKTHTIHFPSNLQSKISTLTGYPLFGGTSGYVVLAFDLPATS